MKLEKLDLGKIDDVRRALLRPFDRIVFHEALSMLDVLSTSGKNLTVHLYPQRLRPYSRKNLFRYSDSSSNQIYLSVLDGALHACFCNSTGSSRREKHSRMIDAFLSGWRLRKKVPSAVIVSIDDHILAYYFHDSFAYVNSSVGSNYPQKPDLYERVQRSRMPYSQLSGSLDDGKNIEFVSPEGCELVYRSLSEDVFMRRVRERLAKGL